MNRKYIQNRFPMIGAGSLLVIFAVLCLTVFSLLGLSAAQANTRLTDHALQAVSDYYAADCAAETILAQLRAGQFPQGVTEHDNSYTYCCPISDSRSLFVEVRRNDWKVLRWQTVSTLHWQEQDDLALLGSGR